MSAGPCVSELLLVYVQIDPRWLEDLLETLANSQHPINPQIYHARQDIERFTLVEFPAYEEWLPEIRSLLTRGGFRDSSLHVIGMLDQIRTGAADTVTILKGPLRAAKAAS